MVMNNKELLDRIHGYGRSELWESELALELNIPKRGVSLLAQEAGFYRHKIVKQVDLATFTASPYTKYIIKKKELNIVEE